MSFNVTARDIWLENKHILKGKLQDGSGNFHPTEVDLNHFIGNNDGRFEWGGKDFSHTAEWASLSMEGDGSVPVLRAGLRKVDGSVHDHDINLNERLANDGGRFVFR